MPLGGGRQHERIGVGQIRGHAPVLDDGHELGGDARGARSASRLRRAGPSPMNVSMRSNRPASLAAASTIAPRFFSSESRPT